jgi:MarR family transcriptional regulator, transcriptional regulator for hemolysin
MPALKAARRAPGRARPAADRIGFHLMYLGRRWRQAVDTELESYGLSHATWRPLLKLACAGEPLRQHELADLLQVGHPELVRLIDSLERKHLVVRHEASDDRRVKWIQLTPSGRRLADQVEALIAAFERRILRGISLADRARCRDVFARIEERLDALPAVPKPKTRARTP